MPGLHRSTKAYALASLIENGKRLVIVADSSDDAEILYRDLSFFLGTSDNEAANDGIWFLGSDEKSPFEAHSPDPKAVMERIGTLYRLARETSQMRALVVTPDAFARKHIPSSCFTDNFEYLVNGCLLYTSPSPRDQRGSRMPSSA